MFSAHVKFALSVTDHEKLATVYH